MRDLFILATLAREQSIKVSIESSVQEEGLFIRADDKFSRALYTKQVFNDEDISYALLEVLSILHRRKGNKDGK